MDVDEDPLLTAFKPINPQNSSDDEARVSDLLLEQPRRWNIDKLQEVFWSVDIEEIVNNPLGNNSASDILYGITPVI